MAGMEGLGRVFNIIPTADAVYVDMTKCSAVTFVCVGADTYTLNEAKTIGGGSAQNLLKWDHWYTNAGAVGVTAWVEASDATPAAAAIIAANAVLTVGADDLSDGFTHVDMVSTGAGLVYAITHDLVVQRDPANLPVVSL